MNRVSRVSRKLGLFAACVAFVGGALIASAPSARAVTLTWSLLDFEFETAGTATGSFDYDAATNDFSAIDITTTPGFFGSETTSYGLPTGTGSASFFDTTTTGNLEIGDRRFVFYLRSPMTDLGGMISLNISTVPNPTSFPPPTSAEGICSFPDPIPFVSGTKCTNLDPFRSLKAGWITASPESIAALSGSIAVSNVPLPAALPLFACALGLLGVLGWRRRRYVAAV